jgi:phage shock protein A
MTKEETRTLAVVVERLDGLKTDTGEIKEHLAQINGTVGRHELTIAEAKRIAESAEKQAKFACSKAEDEKEKRNKLTTKIYVGAISVLATGLIAVLVAWIQTS